MKTTIGILIIVLFAALGSSRAQNRITARAQNYDISENLDLKAVATIFGDSRDLEEFEQRLNDPDLHISNLDLNNDGYVDYLRVIETRDDDITEVVVQAVLGDDLYQDVATIDVERDRGGAPVVQIVGDPYLYGPDYIFEPIWVRSPVIFGFFWGSNYRPWHSPYHWGYYPSHYRYWRPIPTPRYMRNVNVHISVGPRFDFNVSRRIAFPGNYHNQFLRDDYARRYPDHSFNRRHEGVKNQTELHRRRSTEANYDRRPAERENRRERPETYQNRTQRNMTDRQPDYNMNERRQERRVTDNQRERRVTESQPQKRMIERRTTEPMRQPGNNNVITRPDRRVETTKKTTVTRRTETAPSQRETQRVRTNPKIEKKAESTDKKANDRSERRRRE